MNFDADYPYGEEGEQLVRRYGELITRGEAACEVKRKRRPDLKFYVEQEQTRRGGDGDRVPSGIATTDAELVAYVLADTGIVVLLPTELLRHAATVLGEPKEQPQRHNGNPTRGTLIALRQILDRYEPDRSGWEPPAGGWKEVGEIV